MDRYGIYTILKQIRDGKKSNNTINPNNKKFLENANLLDLEELKNVDPVEVKEAFLMLLESIKLIQE